MTCAGGTLALAALPARAALMRTVARERHLAMEFNLCMNELADDLTRPSQRPPPHLAQAGHKS